MSEDPTPFPRTTAFLAGLEQAPESSASEDGTATAVAGYLDDDVRTIEDVYNLVYDVDEKIDALTETVNRLLEQNNWLGSNMIPAVAGLHQKIDSIVAQVQGFVQMVSTARIPGLSKAMRGGVPNAHPQAEEEGSSPAGR